MTGAELGLIMIIIGIIMLIAEIFAPGAFLLVPATVLIVLGAIGMIAPDILLSWWSPIIAVVLIVPMTLITVRMYQKLSPPMPPTTTVATSLIGQEGVVVTKVCPGNIKGKVKIKSDVWSATSDQNIPVGARVVVVHSEGVHVRVKQIGEATTSTECD
ncbi:MAG: NfeD family protein [Methanomassiliicoccaceae archaeon]|jgi:membrane protein implicated in regulation of membrane protease activity|nr:NfeD family protein [Methanomassiliicoccaceae archaeon]HOL06892.1 NfeD family protein [Methanomassiliicoccaceae archaeon]HOQ26563.1 NfeD family protein [Methanomassiliicoccaceae archaeon]HPP45174.1 NfeD family protein [Methanomassiliicoccaceae archaeon]HQA21355.1 NfeD family protein [Methanomassiliicoccaceae archaeon]